MDTNWRHEKLRGSMRKERQNKQENVDVFCISCFALMCAEEFRAQLANIKDEYGHEEMHKKFMAIAEEESDCGSAKKGGDLGVFEKGERS
jgi:hypothetical protein